MSAVEAKSKTLCNHACNNLENFNHDSQTNSTMMKKSTYQTTNCLSTEKCSKQIANCYEGGYKLNQEAQTYSKTSEKKPVQFTEEMIRDQELLVSSMKQQGIPAALIRRQFDRLLEEQNKLLSKLQFHETTRTVNKKSSRENVEFDKQFPNKEDLSHKCSQSSSSYVKTNNSQNAIHCSKKLTENERRAKKLEPSSLLKIRAEKESIDLQSRNNGLQEPEKAFKIMEKCKTKFTVSCNNVKLNGTQDENETKDLLAAQIYDTSNMCKKQLSANGLENSRNTYHSAATLKSCEEKQNVHHSECHCNVPSHISPAHVKGSADSCPLTKNAMPTNAPVSQAPPQTCSDNRTKENSIAQYENLDNLTCHSELLEPKIIGGLVYFARKP